VAAVGPGREANDDPAVLARSSAVAVGPAGDGILLAGERKFEPRRFVRDDDKRFDRREFERRFERDDDEREFRFRRFPFFFDDFDDFFEFD
jgi:hypothetical protein